MAWSVTQAGAASHVKYLADIIGTPCTVFDGWTDDLDIDGIHVFARSLSPEQAGTDRPLTPCRCRFRCLTILRPATHCRSCLQHS
ncbi:hypothetical protein [Streptomyces cyanogenus]|uniref:Uncharacterized protein n=1 Tax=Streptomyces cyanogenus TaxID=80860 RepID=A0ABX7U277_STRCY|nr:hypothetical protein [Streptomyces cyanogenus]QTE03136.1 hypothetical protein S1361_37720 [Streptomyces cyanogenus]